LNPTYTQKTGRQNFSKDSRPLSSGTSPALTCFQRGFKSRQVGRYHISNVIAFVSTVLNPPIDKSFLGAVPGLITVLLHQHLFPGMLSERILPAVSHADRIADHRYLLDRERPGIAAVPLGHDRQDHRPFYIFVGGWLWRIRPVGHHNKGPNDKEPRHAPHRQGYIECYVFHVDAKLVQTAMAR